MKNPLSPRFLTSTRASIIPAGTKIHLLVAAILLCSTGTLTVVGVPFDVKASVKGFNGAQKIGTLDPKSGPAADTDHFTAKFEFVDPFKGSILDGWYDFRWVQLVTKITKDGVDQEEPLLGKLPAIDPPPNDNPDPKDNAPYYYNGKEWTDGTFGTAPNIETIRKEGEFSLLSDSPQNIKGVVVSFESFLVVSDITAGDFKGTKFCVLAGFNWTYTGGTEGTAGEDTSTFGNQIAVDAAAIGRITTALGNASVGGDFKGWQALTDCVLKPCPDGGATSVLLALGFSGMVLVASRQRKKIALRQ